MLRRDDVIEALRLRYDHFSALAVLEAALARAGLADQPVLDAPAAAQLRGALHQVGDRLGAVDARLDELSGGGAGAGKPAEAPAKPVAEPAAKPAAAEPAKPAPSPVKAAASEAAKPAPAPEAEHEPQGKAKHAHEPQGKAKHAHEPQGKAKHAHDAKHAHGASAVTLVLTGIEPDAGAHVLACGAGPLLGDWDPAHAVALHRDGKAWTATLDAPPGAELAFKFLVRKPDGTLTWEDGDDRHAHAGDRVEATWRRAPA